MKRKNISDRLESKLLSINPRLLHFLKGFALGEKAYDRYEEVCRLNFHGTDREWKRVKKTGTPFYRGFQIYKCTDPLYSDSIILLYAPNTLRYKIGQRKT